jgi:hypothetical protein
MIILTLLEYIIKLSFYSVLFISLCLLMLYLMQDKMLYIPDAPNAAFRYPENNPKTYRNPSERNITYDDVSIVTKDKVTLRGWFLK